MSCRMDKITESCSIWEIGFATGVFGNLTRSIPKKAANEFIYWPLSLRAILAKYLDVCETTATATHILQATFRVLINIVLKLRAVRGRIASPGCLLCSLSGAGERTSRCHYCRAERSPGGHLGDVVGSGALNANSFPLSTPALLSIKTLQCVYVGRGPFTWEVHSGRIGLFWQLLVWNASSLDSLWP